jgi:hypothetical protein
MPHKPAVKVLKEEDFATPWRLYIFMGLIPIIIFGVSLAIAAVRKKESESKTQSLKPNTMYLVHTSKLSLGIEADIKLLTEIPAPGAPLEYMVKFRREGPQHQFRYRLQVPEGVQVVSGAIQGLLDLAGNNDPEVRFALQQHDLSTRNITLLIEDVKSRSTKAFVFTTLDFHIRSEQQAALNERRDKYHHNQVEFREHK